MHQIELLKEASIVTGVAIALVVAVALLAGIIETANVLLWLIL